jgi:hypothetical protein
VEKAIPEAVSEFGRDDDAGVLAVEPRIVELEFPERMRLGDSDIIRVALVPERDGYVVITEIDGSITQTQTVIVRRPKGYRVSAVGLLTGVNFEIDQPERVADVALGERVDFRWTISARQAGAQRLSLDLKLRWTPVDLAKTQPDDSALYGRSLPIQVDSVFGMSGAQASQAGVAGLALGVGVSLFALIASPRGRRIRQTLGFAEPNPNVVLEPQASMVLNAGEGKLLQTLFRRYARVVLEREFRSGYSGARAFLALPIREDGRADAYTIAKIGARASIQQEFDNFEQFVKDTLPPITARIQETPLAVASGDKAQAILRYTFIGEPGKLPVSLREALLVNPDPAPIHRLFDTFGPNWWMQRKPYTFRLAEEYDRMLPAHYVIERMEPTRQVTGSLDGALPPDAGAFAIGDVLVLRNFPNSERRPDGSGYSLAGTSRPGQVQPRVRFNTASQAAPSEPLYGRVVATRDSLLRSYVQGMDLYGLPDPFARVPGLLNESVQGTQSTLHGDLNLENVLIGLGGIVWLIDFANTRDGHTLQDFAHLEADVIAHVIAPQIADPQAHLNLAAAAPQFDALRVALRSLGLRCLFNPSQPREYDLALSMACLGALKYRNLDAHQRHVLYLTAAQILAK